MKQSKLNQIFLFLLLILSAMNSCAVRSSEEQQPIASLGIRWALLENTKEDTCVAQFSFFNLGSDTIKYENWALYFNQNTLHPAEMPQAELGVVEHINGDLYRFLPGENFLLSPGDSLMVKYTYRGHLIKERDAPIGGYFVFNPGTSKEKIVLPASFTAAPFDHLEAIFPSPDLRSTVPTASRTYTNNQYISQLPTAQIGKVIPSPAKIVPATGEVQIDQSTLITYEKGLKNEAQLLAESLQKLFGIKLKLSREIGITKNAIDLKSAPVRVAGVNQEAYRLSIHPQQPIQITGTDAAGVFYGIQSLLALLWADQKTTGLVAQSVDIEDTPRFVYRGFLLDVSRNFQQKQDVLRLIDLLASYKINKLNIRISEDEGWRIEIKGLPELTQVGSKRGHTRDSKNWLSPSFGSGPYPDSKNNFGNGYYTREDFKEILKYAHQRHVQVIPEVCLPSHARAAIKAMEARYDYYMTRNEPQKANEFRLIDPNDKSVYTSAQLYKDNIVCVALPSVYHFYETVIKDFMAMYEEAGLKMTLFNTGGDEVPNGAWTKSPLCNELLKSLPSIKDHRQLQGYFLEKAMAIFEKYNLQVSGWEEIVLNKDKDNNATVNPKFVGKKVLPLVWDNTDNNIDLGYRIANAGYPVVLCNVTNLYFDLAYNTDPKEPGLYWGGFQDAIDPYVMAPYDVFKTAHFDSFGRLGNTEETFLGKQRLAPINRQNIIGLQAQLWSETLKGAQMMEYYAMPKLFAFAEKAWAQPPSWEQEANLSRRNEAILSGWNELANRIGQHEFGKLDAWFGTYNYRIAPPGAIIEEGILKANVAFPGLSIRYTTNGLEPDAHSPLYSVPLKAKSLIKLRAFNRSGRGSRVVTILPNFVKNSN